jgi:hypothetical protein
MRKSNQCSGCGISCAFENDVRQKAQVTEDDTFFLSGFREQWGARLETNGVQRLILSTLSVSVGRPPRLNPFETKKRGPDRAGMRFGKLDWRSERDSNPRDGSPPTHFPGVRLRPLGHRSVVGV